ncbi:MAG: transglycosylase SLT domain-containing protein [Gemmatimonas sp.]|nr:transglycosylase SLT domain-containing protein [Gemmatimonas sp.]
MPMLRISEKARTMLAVGIPAAVLAVAMIAGPLLSAEWGWRTPLLDDLESLTELDAVRALPRTEAVLAALEGQRQLDAGLPYAAWQTLRKHIDLDGQAGQTVNLLAAEAAFEWGGWSEVRALLAERPWVSEFAGGEGALLLARAEQELGDETAAIRGYRSYLAIPNAPERGIASARLGGLLAERGDHVTAALFFEAAAAGVPEVADWLRVKQVEQLVEAGDPMATSVASRQTGGSAAARLRRLELEASGWITAAETERAIDRLDWEARVLSAEGAYAEAGQLQLDRARLLLRSMRPEVGRELLRVVAEDTRAPATIRRDAAAELGELDGLTAGEELARASAYEAGSRPGLAARSLRRTFELGDSSTPEQVLHLADLLFEESDYGGARSEYERADEVLTDPEAKASAVLGAARSLHRRGGSRNRQKALEEYRGIAEDHAGTAAAGSALFYLGDAASTRESGLAYYRRAAAIPSSPNAREALFRVGDRSLRLDDTAGAIRAWEQYVARYPRGEPTSDVAYEVGRLHETAGRAARARPMYQAAMSADPVSYYAVRAAEKLGVNSLDDVLAEPEPWVGLASEPAEAAAVLRRLDQLDELGLEEAWEAEYESALRSFERQPLARLVLAEGMRDRFRPVEGIRLGRQLLSERNGEWDERLLRVVFPFLYQEAIVAEAQRADIDPIFYAALVRQESAFQAAVKSRVGATGLGQIMPSTGRWLASAVGITDYQQSLLEIPEVNLRMGTRYIRDLLRRYNGAEDLALAGYNAGPGRADRWRRQFNYGRDTDRFREAIPFDETRHYVKIVLRNESVYRRLYGKD